MAPQRKISQAQLDNLLSTLEADKEMASGVIITCGQGRATLDQRWAALVTMLNSDATGITKTVKQWRGYWAEMKYAVRKKLCKYKDDSTGTGGGPARSTSLTPMEERILSIIGGRKAVLGLESVQIPFDLPSTSSTTQLRFPTSSQLFSPPSPQPSHTPQLPSPVPEEIIEEAAVEEVQEPPRRTQAGRPQRESHHQGVPRWVMDLEERRLSNEASTAAALTSIAKSMHDLTKQLTINNLLMARALGVTVDSLVEDE